MFGEKTMESSSTTGTGAYALGTSVGAFKTWRSQIADGGTAFYYAENGTGTIWECGYGTLTYGSPDSLSRTLIASSTGSLVSWVGGDAPIYVMSTPSAAMMKHALAPLANGTRPGWLPAAGMWLDYALGLAVGWVKKRWTGTVDIEEGRFDITNGIFIPSPRNSWIDKSTASYTVVAADVGKVFAFDQNGGGRTITLPAGATFGHGATFGFIGYGSTTNHLTVTPNGSEAIDTGANSASVLFVPNVLHWLRWDAAKSKWRSSVSRQPGAVAIASAATLNLDSVPGDLVDVSGTTTITAVTLAEGVEKTCRATGAFVITNGGSLVNIGGANITTVSGDIFKLRGYASGVVRMVSYQRASGEALITSNRRFRAHKNGTDQTDGGTTPTKVTFGTESFDVGGYFDTSTSRWTPPAGEWPVQVAINYDTTGTGDNHFHVYLYKNGSSFAEVEAPFYSTSFNSPVTVTLAATVQANGTDYFEVFAKNMSTATRDIKGGATKTWFSGG